MTTLKIPTEALFSPRGSVSWKISGLIMAAVGEISIAVYAFSAKRLANALAKAAKRGVKVRIILDNENARKRYSLDEWLIAQGIEVHFLSVKGGSMHHKFMIVDRKALVAGSYNFTNDAEFRNHDAAIFTANRALVRAFAIEFERLWSL
jgi:mitochondrial cardiolipin hydrolase